jgi:hypothetical protein
MEQPQSGRLRAGAERTTPENQFDQSEGKSLFRLLLEVETELRKMARADSRGLGNKLPIISRTKDGTQPRSSERLSRYIE